MNTIYRVDYSEQTGYYVEVYDGVIRTDQETWESLNGSEKQLAYAEGWRESEQEAVDVWRDDLRKQAAAFRQLSIDTYDMASGPAPTIPKEPLMKPIFRYP